MPAEEAAEYVHRPGRIPPPLGSHTRLKKDVPVRRAIDDVVGEPAGPNAKSFLGGHIFSFSTARPRGAAEAVHGRFLAGTGRRAG